MTLRHAIPITWRGQGLTDTLDSSASAEGSMSSLQNLIQDPSTQGVWLCRPAASLLIDFNSMGGPFSSGFSPGFLTSFFGGFNQAGMISCMLVVGDLVYGMIGGPGGFDYPFVFSMLTKHVVAITGGLDTTKLPVTVSQAGEWSPAPPSMAVDGTKVLVCHPGFLGGGTNNYFGYFDINNPATPAWNAGNLTGAVTFLTPPTAVANFNGRAYWLLNPPTGTPAAIFSDVLVPLNVTSASQIITFDDQVRLTAFAPLPLNNQLGGIVQALMVFKGSAQTYQITGDAALGNLSKNALNVATGTDAPLSISVTTKGIAFAAPDGLRIIDFNAQVTDPIGWDGHGKVLPFLNSVLSNRMIGAATGTYYRITVKDGSLPGAPFVEYWFDTVRGKWSGPHTFPAYAMDAYRNTFVMSAIGVPGKLWQSDTVQKSTSTFVENGTQMNFNYQTSLLPDTDRMEENFMVETTVDMAMQSNVVYSATANGASGDVIQQQQITLQATSPLWGTAVWGAFTWGGLQGVLFPRPVNWTAPVVFRRMALGLNGPCDINVKLGAWRCRYQRLGYLQQSLVA